MKKENNNPWENISLDVYEKHMSLDSVQQLQTMNFIMKKQFEAYPVKTAMVLGIAGGNGLEHVSARKYHAVYGIDINEEYLCAVSKRYKDLNILHYLHLDLTKDSERLPEAQLIIANLLIEYIGYESFKKAVLQVKPEYISCVVQINKDEKQWVSDSPYIHAFDGLDAVHHQMEEHELTTAMEETGYSKILQEAEVLPNGKALLRIDYSRKETIYRRTHES